MRVGLAQGWSSTPTEARELLGHPDVALVDLREPREREKHGILPGSIHAPYPQLAEHIRPGGMLYELAAATGKRLIFYCAFGERSAMAVQAAQGAGMFPEGIAGRAAIPSCFPASDRAPMGIPPAAGAGPRRFTAADAVPGVGAPQAPL